MSSRDPSVQHPCRHRSIFRRPERLRGARRPLPPRRLESTIDSPRRAQPLDCARGALRDVDGREPRAASPANPAPRIILFLAALIPFAALRPTPAAAARVAAVPYDVVSTDEARVLANGNPLSFLHVSRAEIDRPAETNPYADSVYATAVANFERLRTAAPLVLEDSPSVYVYRLWMGDHQQTGVAACYSMDEYERDVIRKHEKTRRDKEDDRTRHMLALRAQTGPAFLTYRASADVDAVVERVVTAAPLFDFRAPDDVHHTVWRAGAGADAELIAAFGSIGALYIADGHHRAASAARARQHLGGESAAPGEWDSFLAVAFPDDQVQILPYNRIVRDLGAHTPETFLRAVRERYEIVDGPAMPVRRGHVAMFLDRRWYTVILGDAPAGLAPADRLDVSRLQETVLAPLLGIGDVRTDKRIDFVGGARGTEELERLVSSGQAAVAFSLYPVSVGDLMHVCDAGGIMPPKSTWFEPKLRDGLLVHVI